MITFIVRRLPCSPSSRRGRSRCCRSSLSSCRPVISSMPTSLASRQAAARCRWRKRSRCASSTASTSPITCSTCKWIGRVLKGDFGEFMEWQRPVSEVLGDRLWMTVVVSFAALLLTWGLALPIGIYSAVRQYSIGDYVFTFLGFIGLAVPNFLLALIILYLSFRWFGANVGGLFSAEYGACRLELGQGARPHVALAAPGADPGTRRHRPADPHHARQSARRAAQALRRHGARQGSDARCA